MNARLILRTSATFALLCLAGVFAPAPAVAGDIIRGCPLARECFECSTSPRVFWVLPERCYCTPANGFKHHCWADVGNAGDNCCYAECHVDAPEQPCYVPGTPIEEPGTPPACGGGGDGPNGPCGSVGQPVSLTTGEMFFTQTDAAVGELVLSRTYDTVRTLATRYGAFGPGWNASLDLRLRIVTADTLEARLADGRAQYYNDENDDGRFDGVYPYTQDSWIETLPGGGYKRALRTGAYETYDAAGLLQSATDATGVVTTYTRDGIGRLTSVMRRGRTLTFSYESNSTQITRALGPNGVVLASYGYGSNGVLESVAYPDGTGYRYVYDAANRIISVTDFAGRTVETHAYDFQGRATTSQIADGREKLTFAYGTGQTTVTDALGNATVYTIADVRGVKRITQRTGPCSGCGGGTGETEEWTYDEFGRITQATDAAGTVSRYTYNSHDDLLTATEAYGTALERTTSHAYTYDGERIVTETRTAPDGGVTTTTYGLAGPTQIDQQVSASETRTTTMTYTAAGQLETIKDPRGQTTGLVTTLAYNPTTGDLTSTTDPLTHATTFGYDDFGRRTTTTDALTHTTTTTYDARGRVSRITAHDGTHTDFGYDSSGRRTSVTDPLGRATSYAYDDYGWLQQVTDAAGGVTAYGYDLMGHMTSLTDANGHTTSFEYDDYGRVEKVIYPGGAFETFTYDGAGRLATKTDRKSVVTTYSYDVLGRLTGKTYSDGTTPPVTYTYDQNGQIGRLTSAANGTDTLTRTYNWAGELLSEQSAKNASTVAYTCDVRGNRLTVSLDGVLHVTYGYDDASRLTTITRGTAVFGFAYDNANRRTSMTYPNGVTTTYGYDDLNRLLNLSAVHVPTSTTITNFTYTYDDAGNRLTKALPDHTETYGYDKLYQLTTVDRTGTPTKRWGFTYDPVGNRLSNQADNSVASATYNERNQLVNQTAGGPVRWRGHLDEVGTVTFTSATLNGQPARMLPGNVFEADLDMTPSTNLVTLQATDASNNTRTQQYSVDVSGDGATYTYDANGNLATKVEGSDTWVYTWNAENQLIKAEKNSVEVARFGYDPLGRRVEKVAGGVTTAWTYDGASILRETLGAGATFKYVHGPGIDEPLARQDGAGTFTHYHADGLGSIVKMTDALGAVVQTRRYDAWGNLESGTDDSGHGFTGREWDPETGLYYYRARYYDAATSRFISEDPIQFDGGLDFYAYVSSNPVNAVDPLGLQAAPEGGTVPLPPRVCRVIPFRQAPAASPPTLAGGILGAFLIVLTAASPAGGPGDEVGTVECAPAPTPEPCPNNGCKPCDPPVGTRAYRLDTSGPPHAGIAPPHWQMFEMHQAPLNSPKPCKCFWKKLKREFGPGSAPPTGEPPVHPAGGGGPA